MAAIRLKAGESFDGESLYAFTGDTLPSYAAPRFVRIQVSAPGFTQASRWLPGDRGLVWCIFSPPQSSVKLGLRTKGDSATRAPASLSNDRIGVPPVSDDGASHPACQ